MNINIPFRRQVLAGALALTLVAACLPAAPQQPAATPSPALAPTVPPVTAVAPTENAAPTTAPAAPTATYTVPVSDFSKLPDPLQGWQVGDRSVPITITEYGDFQ